MKEFLRDVVGLGIFLIVSYIIGYLIFSPAFGHDFYSIECCSDKDCGPVPATAVKAERQGWRIVETGELIGYGDKRLKESPDGDFHWCSRPKTYTPNYRTICLYVPPMVF